MDEYGSLSAAIIHQAVTDYYSITKKYRKEKKELSKWTKNQLKSTVKFFRSDWYDKLAYCCGLKLTGEELMQLLNKKIDEGIPLREYD